MTAERTQVLIADDEPNLRRVVAAQLTRDGFDVHSAEDGERALAMLAEHHIDLVITDLRMPKLDGMGVLRHVVAHYPNVPVIMITAHGTIDTAVEALKLGAFDYVTKPFDRNEFQAVVSKAARSLELSQELYLGDGPASTAHPLVGRSEAMRAIYETIERLGDSPDPVLIVGESGTGKELVARALHHSSGRAQRPFIRLHCAALSAEQIESELFGYEQGAFRGAASSKPGRLELAHGGTLFLDEISEIPLALQSKLLTAVQDGRVQRVGGLRTLSVDVRLTAATQRNLGGDVRAGRFDEGLYGVLLRHVIELPPLRERRGDIPALVDHFLSRDNARLNKHVRRVSPDALAALVAAPWPGNIRELENVIERCVLFCDGDELGWRTLPAELRNEQEPGASRQSGSWPPAQVPEAESGGLKDGLKEAVREATLRLERDLIVRALEETHHNVTHAARLLKISRKSLQTKMKELGLREEN